MASSPSSELVICDAGPLIHLDELQCIDLLGVYDDVWVPAVVWGEVALHRPSALRRRGVRLRRVDVIPEPPPDTEALLDAFALDDGERDALRLLASQAGARLLTDDAIARAAAGSLGYKVRGTLGVLLDALSLGLRTKRQLLHLLKTIRKRSTLFVAEDLLQGVIRRVEGSFP